MIKKIIKKFVPAFLLQMYHKALAVLAAVLYGFPSKKIIVIGVTGTNGKSTTIDILTRILEQSGENVGVSSTIKFKVGEKEWLNDKKMTMPGRFQLQKLLDRMVKAGCKFAIIETTSQGIEQFRHLGVNYDVAVFTNLTPEHIEAHGGFENYKKAKGKLFEHLMAMPHKRFGGTRISKVSVINVDDEHADFFLQFKADWKYGYGIDGNKMDVTMMRARDIKYGESVTFDVNNIPITTHLPGRFNIYNILAAISVAQHFGVSWNSIQKTLDTSFGVEGRVEYISKGQPFKVIVDYAHEPHAVEQLYNVVETLSHKRILHVLGSCGGGRDAARRPLLGALAARNADSVIVTDEDPYDEDPRSIMDQVAQGAYDILGKDAKNIRIIEDRREAIRFALQTAEKNDIVLITGKGSEQAMVVGDKHIPWDDRKVVREELKALYKK